MRQREVMGLEIVACLHAGVVGEGLRNGEGGAGRGLGTGGKSETRAKYNNSNKAPEVTTSP